MRVELTRGDTYLATSSWRIKKRYKHGVEIKLGGSACLVAAL